MTKPFDPRELLARVKSVMRRMQARPVPTAATDGATVAANPRHLTDFGRCRLDVEARRLFGPDGRRGARSPRWNSNCCKVFVEHPGKALSRDRLLTLTRNREWDPFDRSIDIRVARAAPQDRGRARMRPSVIRTVRGVGYMYVPTAD